MQHMTLELRIMIESMLNERRSVSEIAEALGRHRTTICREIKDRRSTFDSERRRSCGTLMRPPYVCNGCGKFKACDLRRYRYVAQAAQSNYRSLLVDSRSGANITEEELAVIDRIVSAGIAKGQSLHHIMRSCADRIPICEKTLYRYVHARLLSVFMHNLPQAPYRRPRLKPRKSRAPRRADREYLKGRTYDDWLAFVRANPGVETVEIDSVIGRVGGKCLLTMNLNCCGLMLAFLRDHNDAKSVKDVFDSLSRKLGPEKFGEIFPVLLADNGTEFSDPEGIEFGPDGRRRTRVFFCDPYSSSQKPHVENNHENLRKVYPKGSSFDGLTQDDVDLALCNVNSMERKAYDDMTAIERFIRKFGEKALRSLGLRAVPATEVDLTAKTRKGR